MCIVLQDGPEEDTLVGALRTQVLNDDQTKMFVVMNAIEDKHRYKFICRDTQHRTALHASSEPGVSPGLMRILLQPRNRYYGGDPNDQTLNLETALISCVRSDNGESTQRNDALKKARMLLETGAIVKIKGFLGMSPLIHVQSLEMAKLLIFHGADSVINDVDDFGRTALFYSIEKGELEISQFLVQHGADISIERHKIPNTHNAMRNLRKILDVNDDRMNIDMLQFVLENGASITSDSYDGKSVLDVATSMENRYAVRLVELVIAELPADTISWTPTNVDNALHSILMSQHTRPGQMSGMCSILPEHIQKVIQELKKSIPTNIVKDAMSRIKGRHNGRYPIQDSDQPR